MFRSMPLVLVSIIVTIILFGDFIPFEWKSILYALSLSIKSIIVFLLPIIIFGLLFKTAVTLSHNATKMILFILVALCCSNFLSTMVSHVVGAWVYHFDLSLRIPTQIQELTPYWNYELPKLIANDKAMFAGLILGILASMYKPNLAEICAAKLENIVAKILNTFTYLIPIFVTGFIVKLQHEGIVLTILKDYALIFIVIALTQLIYISLIYLIPTRFNLVASIQSIKNMLPAAITGFSTMSSAAAMPITIMGTEKNTNDSDLARSIIPATVNIHLIGDCLAIPIFAYAILKNYGIAEPAFIDYLTFAFFFILAKFSVAAIPGGGIIVMLPILEKYLGFNAEMMSLITALYILFDPVITCANVFGNGGFALVINKLRPKF